MTNKIKRQGREWENIQTTCLKYIKYRRNSYNLLAKINNNNNNTKVSAIRKPDN